MILFIWGKAARQLEESKTSVLSRVFTRNMLRNFLDRGNDEVFSSVIKRYVTEPNKKCNETLISEIYCELKHNYRNEYFYKNTLLNKLLLGIHSVNTTTALTEISIANSKADFVLINGKAVVYEIKTELDNLDRINSQINDYYKGFDCVSVVTYEKNLEPLQRVLEKAGRPIGIYILRQNERLGTIKKPEQYRCDLDKGVIFKLLRKKEYENLIIGKFGYLPDVRQFEYYSACKDMFFQIPVEESYQLTLKQLKRRVKVEIEDFAKVPYELRFLAYFMKLQKSDYRNLDMFLKNQYEGA